MQKWCYSYGIDEAAFALISYTILNDVNHVHWFAYSQMGHGVLMILLLLNSIFYYAVRGQLEMGLPSTCLTFINIGVLNQFHFLCKIHICENWLLLRN